MNRGSDNQLDEDKSVTEKDVNDFVIQLVTTVARVQEEGISLPRPANDNNPKDRGYDDTA